MNIVRAVSGTCIGKVAVVWHSEATVGLFLACDAVIAGTRTARWKCLGRCVVCGENAGLKCPKLERASLRDVRITGEAGFMMAQSYVETVLEY